MKIFGIGLSRTGTASLAEALRVLGYSAIHFPCTLKEIDWHEAATDTPVAIGFEFLDLMYPGSRFIYTRRESKGWLQSCESFWKRMPEHPFHPKLHAGLYGMPAGFDRDMFLQAYRQHEIRVRSYFHVRFDLLAINICGGDGWGQLCPFLGKTKPNAPFPHLHKMD